MSNHKTIEHHHLLLRMETKRCPLQDDKEEAKQLVHDIIRDIGMHLLGEARVFYVELPRYNEGLTALAPIQTSHIAFHFWKSPDKDILQNSESQCLLQFDLYTCGKLSLGQIQKILRHLTHYHPTHVNATILNRNLSLTVENQIVWDGVESSWSDWVSEIPRNLYHQEKRNHRFLGSRKRKTQKRKQSRHK